MFELVATTLIARPLPERRVVRNKGRISGQLEQIDQTIDI
jgi:hypothetical protein